MKITRRTPAVGNTKNVGIAVSLKHLRNLCRTLEISLVYCEINLMLTFSKSCFVSAATRAKCKTLVALVTLVTLVALSTRDNSMLLLQLI